MGKQILTLDNLYQFFMQQNKAVHFNAKETQQPIVVSVPGNFEVQDNDMPGLLKLQLKVCHTELNRNGSFISEANMKNAMPTLKYRPVLAYIHQLEDGTLDFYAHNIEISQDENGEEKVIYIEKQVGCFTADEPYLEYDEEMERTYVKANAVIPEDYTEAANIIRRKNGTKVSCELVINELEYNAKDKYLDLTDFYFNATTLLGCDNDGNEIGEGMLGARADITDFCQKKPIINYQDNSQLIEVLEKLNITLSSFNNKNITLEEGGKEAMNKFEQLLEKYGKKVEDVTFEIEGLSDEELEAKFAEVFQGESEEDENAEGEDNVADEEGAEEPTSEDGEADNTDDETTATENEACGKKKKKCSIDENGNMSVSFEISHEDIRCALYNLVGIYEEEDNEWYFPTQVFDTYFIFENWEGTKLYKQGYKIDGDNVAFDGDRQEVFKMVLTETEKLAIEKLRENYANLEMQYNELKIFKDNYDAATLKAQKDEIFSKSEYAVIAEDDAFKALVADAEKYSVEEIGIKCDLLFAAHVKATFSTEIEEIKKPKSIPMPFNQTTKKRDAYGGLFTSFKEKHGN